MVEAEADISILPVGLMVAMPMDPMDMETIMRITGKTESSSGLAAEEVVVPISKMVTTEALVDHWQGVVQEASEEIIAPTLQETEEMEAMAVEEAVEEAVMAREE